MALKSSPARSAKPAAAQPPSLALARASGADRSSYLHSVAGETRRRTELSEPFVEARGRKNGQPYSFSARRIDERHILEAAAAEAFVRMRRAARAQRIELTINSAFRTQSQQEALEAKSPNKAAAPGRSPHQRGVAVDINVAGGKSAAYRWLRANASKYGFFEKVKGEPWHWQRAEPEKR